MRVAVLSDIHGNLPALLAVLRDINGWGGDLVVMNGDLVSCGPDSLGCLESFSSDVVMTVGNHEAYVMEAAVRPRPGTYFAPARFAAAQLGPRVEELKSFRAELELEGGTLLIRHEPGPLDRDYELVCHGHIHTPFVRDNDGITVVNAGSVGSPNDGDSRASYARLVRGTRWEASIQRVEYDRSATEQAFAESGFVETCGPMGRLVLEDWRQSRPLLQDWAQSSSVDPKDEVGVSESIEGFLAARGLL